jgi:membrane protease YdiL (CAAX protease family)
MQASLPFLTDFLPFAIWYPSTVTEWKIISIVVMCLISIGLWLQSATDPEERIFWRLTPQRHVEPLGFAELFLASAAVFCGMGISAGILHWFPEDYYGFVVGTGGLLGCVAGWLILLPQSRWIKYWFVDPQRNVFLEAGLGVKRVLLVMPWLLILHSLISSLFVKYEHPTLNSLTEATTFAQTASLWFSAVLVAPITEEFLFRGLLIFGIAGLHPAWREGSRNVFGDLILGNLVNLTPARKNVCENGATDVLSEHRQPGLQAGVIVASLLFAGVHWDQGAAPFSLFLLGIFLSWLFIKTRSLWPCIGAHVFFNAFSMFWQTLEPVAN